MIPRFLEPPLHICSVTLRRTKGSSPSRLPPILPIQSPCLALGPWTSPCTGKKRAVEAVPVASPDADIPPSLRPLATIVTCLGCAQPRNGSPTLWLSEPVALSKGLVKITQSDGEGGWEGCAGQARQEPPGDSHWTGQNQIQCLAPKRPEDTAFREPARWSGKELLRLE